MKRNIFTLFVLLFITCLALNSCKEDVPYNVPPIEHASFLLMDEEGNDLLDADKEGAYDVKRIGVYQIVDGKEVYDGGVSGAKCKVGKGGYYVDISLCSRDAVVDNRAKTIVKWSNTEVDTIECNVKQVGRHFSITNAYVNGQLVWDSETPKMSIISGTETTMPEIVLIKKPNMLK